MKGAVMRRIILSALFMILILSTSCSRVMIPPAFDLKPHEVIGIIQFKCNNEGKLAGYTTQKFMEWITTDQKNIAIIELGNDKDILAAIQKEKLGIEEIKLIAQKYQIKSIFMGDIDISDVHPHISIGPGFQFASASAEVEATLTVKLINADNSATIWLGSSRGKSDVGSVGLFGGSFIFDAKDPDAAYGGLVENLVKRTTKDFRNTYKCKCGF